MSLKVRLPLDGDLRNNGIYDLPSPVINTLTYVDGKIGKCGHGRLSWHLSEDILDNKWTVAMWFNSPVNFGSANNVLFCKNISQSSDCQIYFSIISNKTLNIGVNGPFSSLGYSFSFSTNTWYHVAATYDGVEVTLYLNGLAVKSGIVTTAKPEGRLNMMIDGRSTNETGTGYTGGIGMKYNDFRLYNHCLSAAEVHEIAQGLVLHYKLDGGVTTAKNLIKNGYGELGTTNWSTSTNFSSEVPPNHPEIKKSIYSNTTTEYIPIESTHSYKLEVYLKNSATSGSTYPSLYPYDIDKNFIYYYQCPAGFNLTTMTTLKQELKSGDTKIYVNDLSKWNANSGHYYNYAAIFGYSDSTGYIYPDGTYTRITSAFGSSTTAKTNLDKTNNIITLNSAYSGPTKPVGTAICAAAAGSTYYYPFNGLTKSSLNDWTYKTVTMTPDNIARLKYAKYIRYSTYDGTLHAGIKLIDLADDIDSTIVSDSSGYGHNGETINEVTISSDTPRYNSSVQLNGSNTAIKVLDNKWMVQGAEAITINLWAKSSAWAGAHLFSCTESGGFNTEAGSSGYLRFPIHVYTNAEKTSTAYKYDSKEIQISELSTTDWNMLTFVYDSTGTHTYINGNLHHTYSNISYGIHFNTNARLFLGCEANTASPTTPYFNGQISDFRIYCTPLLDTNIKLLYNMSMRVDNLGGVHAFEFEETSSSKNKLTKTGILNNNIIEPYLTLPDGSNWKLMLYHYVDNGNNLFTSSNATYCNDFGLYSRLRDINNYTYNGKYEFYVIQDGKEFRWTQTSQPTASSIAGLTVIEGYNNPVNGLAKANQSNTYIGYGAWWGACGCWTKYSTGGKTGIPGFGSHNGDGICEKYLALYVRVEKNNASFENSSSNSTEFIEI